MTMIQVQLIASTMLAICLAGCSAPVTPAALPATITPLDLVSQAAAEATAIVQQARATALVLQAQAHAAELVEQAGGASEAAQATQALLQTVAPNLNETQATDVEGLSNAGPVTPAALDTVEVLGVGFAAEGGFIIVNFMAPPSIVQDWWQGRVSVTDEVSGTVYNEIPVMPVIGPLIGRPVEAGQRGYVMLTHNPPYLRYGSLVTVMLGNYKFEHVKIQ